jgi:hypothetical protein
MDYQKLFETTEQILILRSGDDVDITWAIMTLRGGPTSGNWAHDGRPGKRGGSGGGGGFKRLRLAKGTTSRPDVVGISRRVRKKRKQEKEKVKRPAGPVKISPEQLSGARATVAKAKKTRDKDLKTARKLTREVEKAESKFRKANDSLGTASDRVSKAQKDVESLSDQLRKKPLDENLNRRFDKAIDKRNRLDTEFREKRDQYNQAILDVGAARDKRGKGPSQDKIQSSFEKETEAASRIMFQGNLNEAKKARSTIKEQSEAATKEIKVLESRLATLETNITGTRRFLETADQGEATSKLFSDRLFRLSQESFGLQTELRNKRKATAENARELLKVNNPTVIRQAPGSQKDKVNRPSLNNRRKQGQAAFQELVSDDVVPKGSLVKYQNTDTGRAFQRNGQTSEVHMDVFSGPDTVVHELGHTAENYNPRLLGRSIEFRDRRTAGEDYQPLTDLTGNQGYRKEEKAKPDKFIHPYIGKDYGKSASEVFSMGIEEMFRDPVGFAEKDPEMFDFIYAQARTP